MRILRIVLPSALGMVAVLGALLFWFVYTPLPPAPKLSGTLAHGSIAVGGRTRTYLLYVPKRLSKRPALVMVLHGSGEDAAQMRLATGYGFERLADAEGFAVVYPNGYEGYWNACNVKGDYAANTLNIDDVGFLNALAAKLEAQLGVEPAKVFAVGLSRGAAMTMRLALEAPQTFRAVAAVSDSLPTPDNFKCKPKAGGTASILIMNGTADPIVPFEGGEVNLFGIFLKRGTVLSTRASGEYFAQRNGIAGAPVVHETILNDGFGIAETRWRGANGKTIEVLAIEGGGHGLPQPYFRNPRLLGPTMPFDGPQAIWTFFAEQSPQ